MKKVIFVLIFSVLAFGQKEQFVPEKPQEILQIHFRLADQIPIQLCRFPKSNFDTLSWQDLKCNNEPKKAHSKSEMLDAKLKATFRLMKLSNLN
jgi:hypothetical protein